MKKYKSKKIKAFGLVESLLALAIFGTAIISATAVTIKALKTVRDNEMADFANSIMIRSLEYTKSSSVTNADFIHTTSPAMYRLTGDVTDLNAQIDIQYVGITQNNILDRNQCEGNPDYLVNLSSNPDLADLVICNQIIINNTQNGNYEITSRIIFQTGDSEFELNEITGYKINE